MRFSSTLFGVSAPSQASMSIDSKRPGTPTETGPSLRSFMRTSADQRRSWAMRRLVPVNAEGTYTMPGTFMSRITGKAWS